MAIAFASTFLTAKTGFPTSCAVSPSVPPTSPSSRAISSASKVHPLSHARCSAMRNNANAMLGTQRNRRKDFDGKPRNHFQMILLLDHGQQQRGFHHREGRAHTNARTSTEGEIRETRDFARANRIFPPAFGVEALRVREKARIALRA